MDADDVAVYGVVVCCTVEIVVSYVGVVVVVVVCVVWC